MVKPLDPGERRRRAGRVKLLLTDVDGVLTDAGVYYSAQGEELKRFSLRDGMAVELLRGQGIETGFLSRERSTSVLQRARKLAVKQLHLGVTDKAAALDAVLAEAQVSLDAVAYMGDDVNDLGVLARVGEFGLTAAPADAVGVVREVVQLCTENRGGHGAFREFADLILHWRNEEDRA